MLRLLAKFSLRKCIKPLGWCGSAEIDGYTIASEISLDNAIVTHAADTSSRLTDTFDCGFVLC